MRGHAVATLGAIDVAGIAADALRLLEDELVVGVLIVLGGVALGYLVGRVNRGILVSVGVPEAVEGTSFERTARNFGTSTVSLLASLSTWFVIGVAVLLALSVADIRYSQLFWTRFTTFLPELFIAVLVMIVGVVVGDKVELVVSERLRGIKLPQISLLPALCKYSVVYIASLIALGQVGVATAALLVLLFAYVFAVVFIGGIAFRDLLTSAAAGMYLLLTQPYGIGDEVRIEEFEGIVQELTVFVTRIEDDDAEYVVPNRRVLETGIVRKRRE
jgi:small-conductance mechanosensitive channel